jgi:hypothetical protein
MAYPLAERPERPKRKPSEYDDKPIGTQFADEAEKALEWASSLPVVRPVLQTVGGALRVGYEKIIEPMKYESEQLLAGREADIPSAVVGSAVRAFEFGTKTGEVLGAEAAEALNVDPRIGSFLGGGVAETVMTAGVGTVAKKAVKAIDMMTPPGAGGLTPALAGSGGGLKLNFDKPRVDVPEAPQVMPLTITEPEFIAPGVKQGIADLPVNVKARQMLDKSLARLDKRRSDLDAMLASGEVKRGSSKFIRLDKKIREERYGEMSSFYNQLDQNPPAYGKAAYKNVDPTDITKKAEQHHLAAKAQTAPFIEVMLEVGDPDDLVALHEYSRMLGVVMGNSKKNMLDAPGPIHRAAAAKTAKEKAGNIHSAFSVAGMEPNNAYVKRLLKDATTADDVMRVFKQYADEYLIPQQDIAKKIVQNYLDEYAITLTKPQLAKFDELASKLSKGS